MRLGAVDLSERVYVIAEIGGNHDGDFGAARELLAAAAGAGADAVKFQVYRGERLVHKDFPAMAHVRHLHSTQRARFKSLEFTADQWRELAGDARRHAVDFMASAFDEESAELIDPLVPAHKVASGEMTNLPLLRQLAATGKPVVMSTGMATYEEIDAALAVVPRDRAALLHCVSVYPTPANQANLRAITRLQARFEVPVGYSDHTVGPNACLAAVALGAAVLEKHFTFDTSKTFGDHRLSATPAEFTGIVRGAREIREELGSGEKVLSEAETRMREAMRRSLYTSRALPAGAALTERDVICLRPAVGLPPAALDGLLGRRTRRALAAEELLREEDFDRV
jgi:N-acetylneuraminate synthase/N,N'-diacetyllegionaminate synthase